MRKLGRYLYLRLRRHPNPDRLARGLAAGVFVGMFPLYGLQSILGVLFATLVGGDKLLAVLGTWISNPLTDIPIFMFNFQVGRWLAQSNLELTYPQSWSEAIDLGRQFLGVWLLGCLCVGTIGAVSSYCLGKWFFDRIKKRGIPLKKS